MNLVTNHGGATPLSWLTVLKDELKDKRNDYEDLCLARLADVVLGRVAVTILGDRVFGDTKLFGYAYVAWRALLQSRAAASSLSHARKARTFAESRRFFGQTNE